jgi:hypothetical protein
MLKPFRLLDDSVRNFAAGFGPGLLLAFVCLAIQWWAVPIIMAPVAAILPPDPEPPQQDFDAFLKGLFEKEYDWRDDARALAGSTVGASTLFFFHALVALILTSWLLRRSAGFDRVRVLRRALRGAAVLTGGAAIVFAAAFLVDDFLPATRYLRYDFGADAMVVLWFGGTALLLPARLMGHQPAPGWRRTTSVVALVLLPWFFLSELFGRPLRHCYDCGGFFEGGLFLYPLLGAYLLGLTVSSAAVSAAAIRQGNLAGADT